MTYTGQQLVLLVNADHSKLSSIISFHWEVFFKKSLLTSSIDGFLINILFKYFVPLTVILLNVILTTSCVYFSLAVIIIMSGGSNNGIATFQKQHRPIHSELREGQFHFQFCGKYQQAF